MKPMHLFRFECVSGKATAALAPAPSSVLSVKMSCPTVPCHVASVSLFDLHLRKKGGGIRRDLHHLVGIPELICHVCIQWLRVSRCNEVVIV